MMTKKSIVSPKYYSALSHTFSPMVMNSLISTGTSRYLAEVIKSSEIIDEMGCDVTMGEFFESIYNLIARSHRSEYVYKNAIANKILLGRHSLNTSYMLTEFRVGNCKADVVILNGTSTVYEIKSEYDSLERLQNQISAYAEVFDRINVITSVSLIPKLEITLPSEIGLMELTSRNTIRTKREAVSGKHRVRPEIIFGCLRRAEYLKITENVFGYVPNVPNTQIYRECQRLFCSLPPEVAHFQMIKVLCQRKERRILQDFMKDVPPSLRAYFISHRLDADRTIKLNALLRSSLKSVLGRDL